ncbi:flavin-containing monooxygenase [Nocardia asteroides]|uniref:flavin-containing monooxygenase n=1 Tax=Nocardia asteroides TaxID=1824 RepID=UPI0037CACE11
MIPDMEFPHNDFGVGGDRSRPTLRVVVVGGGFGGLTMGAELLAAGIRDFLILETADLGGVWRDNVYPGSSCDVPAHLYSFHFDRWRDRRVRYPGQESILNYMREAAQRSGVLAHVRTNTGVESAVYDEADRTWTLVTTGGERIRTEAVVWAVGQLHRPTVPQIAGADEFAGRAFHSARWDPSTDRTGHIAVVGTGSSAAQMVPALAEHAASVTVYQRTPAWVLPKPTASFGPLTSAALRVPGAHRLYRMALERGADLTLAPIMRRGWSAVPAEWIARRHLRRHVTDPVLREQLRPPYPIGAKRILLDNQFYSALSRPNVDLVTEPIDRLTREGILTADGTHRRAETIVWATGFRATEFLHDITVRGRNDLDLHTHWARQGRPEAFYGLAVPGFPNMYFIAGPNSFTPSNSNPSIKAHQARYIRACLNYSSSLGTPVEVTPEAMNRYRTWMERRLAETVWAQGVPAWFTRSDGQITNPWPDTVGTFKRRLAHNRPTAAFEPVTAPSAQPNGQGRAEVAAADRVEADGLLASLALQGRA